MADTKFTPGPWNKITNHEVYLDIGGDNTYSLIGGSEMVAVVCVDEAFGKDDLHSANESLIMSAPDLYEALAFLEEHAKDRCVSDNAWHGAEVVSIQVSIGTLRRAEAALAKARGETND